MAKSKRNKKLLKIIWIIYWVGFVVYILLSRSPNFFTGKITRGRVVDINERTYRAGSRSETHRIPVVFFYINSEERSWSDETINYLGTYSIGDKVTMIYNPRHPEEACMLTLLGYWLNLSEIFIGFLIILIITALITVVPYGYEE